MFRAVGLANLAQDLKVEGRGCMLFLLQRQNRCFPAFDLLSYPLTGVLRDFEFATLMGFSSGRFGWGRMPLLGSEPVQVCAQGCEVFLVLKDSLWAATAAVGPSCSHSCVFVCTLLCRQFLYIYIYIYIYVYIYIYMYTCVCSKLQDQWGFL